MTKTSMKSLDENTYLKFKTQLQFDFNALDFNQCHMYKNL